MAVNDDPSVTRTQGQGEQSPRVKSGPSNQAAIEAYEPEFDREIATQNLNRDLQDKGFLLDRGYHQRVPAGCIG